MSSESSSIDPEALVESWLRCSPSEQKAWLIRYRTVIDLAFLEQLKENSDRLFRTDPQAADIITAGMLRSAEFLSDEPLALPLAWWARGNRFSMNDPQEAVQWYKRALTGYRSSQNRTAILTLISNLLYVMTEVDLAAAEKVYEEELVPWRAHATEQDYPTLLRVEQNAGILLRRLGRYEEALAAHHHALSLAQSLHERERVPEIFGNIALTLGDLGRFHECESYLLQSRSTAVANNNQLTAARMEMNLGELYTLLGRPTDALQAFQKAYDCFSTLGNSMEQASVALREAHLLERIGALPQASRRYRRAKTHFSTLQMWPQVWQATIEGARAKRRYGEYRQAAELLTDAAELLKQHRQPAWRSEWQLEAAALAISRRQYSETQRLLMIWQHETPNQLRTSRLQARHALLWGKLWEQSSTLYCGCDGNRSFHLAKNSGSHSELSIADDKLVCHQQQTAAQRAYQQVLKFAEQQGELHMKRQALAGLGRITRWRDPVHAQMLLLEAAAQDDLIRVDLPVQELKADFLQQSSDLLEQLFVWSVADRVNAAALLHSWRAKGSALIELFSVHQPENQLIYQRAQTADPVLQRIHTLRHRLTTLQWQASQEAQRQKRPQAAVEAELPEIASLEEQLIDLRRQRYQQYRDITHLSQQTVHEISATMTAKTVLIEFMQAQGDLYATVLHPSGAAETICVAAVSDLLDLLDELTLHFRSLLTLPPAHRSQPALLAECRTLLACGYDWLIRPLSLPATATQLLIAPCSPLHRIPFAALWDGERYLTERFQIELTPTAAILTVPWPSLPVTHPLVIADTVDGVLPANRRQIDTIRLYFPDATCLCDDPTALSYLQQLTVAPSFLHIAAHTVEREDAPIFTAMQLTQAMLTVEQSYELPLHGTQLVTLSSCVSNSGMDSAGALLAFQSAFFAAGAQRVLSTLWEIQSEMTEEWMAAFYRYLEAGIAPPIALRHTQLEFIRHTGFCHPVYWAAFACSRR